MIEYLYDCIRASAGSEIAISAKLTNDDGSAINDNCSLVLHSDSEELYEATGVLTGELWVFSIPAAITEGLHGRYWYCIRHNGNPLCFKEPIYLK